MMMNNQTHCIPEIDWDPWKIPVSVSKRNQTFSSFHVSQAKGDTNTVTAPPLLDIYTWLPHGFGIFCQPAAPSPRHVVLGFHTFWTPCDFESPRGQEWAWERVRKVWVQMDGYLGTPVLVVRETKRKTKSRNKPTQNDFENQHLLIWCQPCTNKPMALKSQPKIEALQYPLVFLFIYLSIDRIYLSNLCYLSIHPSIYLSIYPPKMNRFCLAAKDRIRRRQCTSNPAIQHVSTSFKSWCNVCKHFPCFAYAFQQLIPLYLQLFLSEWSILTTYFDLSLKNCPLKNPPPAVFHTS